MTAIPSPAGERSTDGEQRWTDDELLDGIQRALHAGDMLAAAALIRRLAVQAPDAAQHILDGLGVARVLRR